MLNWGIVNKIGVSVHCANEKEANIFLKECEKKNIPWWNGSKATEASPDHRLFSTNGGNFLTAYKRDGDELVKFKTIFMPKRKERWQKLVSQSAI